MAKWYQNILKGWKSGNQEKAFNSYNGTAPGFKVVGGQVVWIGDNIEKYIVDGYSANDIVYSINHITSEKIKVAPWGAYTIEDESSLKRMQAEYKQGITHKNYKLVLGLREKALKPANDPKLNDLLKYPNEQETFSDLVAHTSIDKMITGNRYVKANVLEGGANAGLPQELERLPPQCITIVVSKTFPMRVLGYQFNNGPIIPIEKEQVMHDKYFNPLYDQAGSHFYGMSPLKAARYTLTNENSSLEASTKSFQNMGPGGIAYLDDERMTAEQSVQQLTALKAKWMEEYSGPSNARKIVMSGYKMGYQEIGLSPTDLKIIEQQKWNLVRFCNVWNFPHPLLLPDHLTDNNYAASERALTSRCALPLMTSFRDNFNRKLQSDWGYKGKNIYVDFDLSVFSELQEDMGKLTDWIMKSTHLTVRMKYELQQLEIPEQYKNDPSIDKIYMAPNMVPIEELGQAALDAEMNAVDQQDNQDNQDDNNP